MLLAAPARFPSTTIGTSQRGLLAVQHTPLQGDPTLGTWQSSCLIRNSDTSTSPLPSSTAAGSLPRPPQSASFPGGNEYGHIAPNISRLAGEYLVLSSWESTQWHNALPLWKRSPVMHRPSRDFSQHCRCWVVSAA